jgi:hypothetical protein
MRIFSDVEHTGVAAAGALMCGQVKDQHVQAFHEEVMRDLDTVFA